MKTSIILPAHNEEKRILNALDQLSSYLSQQRIQYEILVSTDGSTDNIEKIVSKYALEHPNIVLVSFPERLGKGGGILNAFHSATGEILIIMDVDLAVPPKLIPPTILQLDEKNADIIFGSRNLPDSVILVQPPFYRKILGKAFNLLFRILFGIKLHDTQCGYKAMRKNVLEKLERDLNIEGFAYDIDLAVKAKKHGYKIVEMPVTWSHMEGSKVNVFKQTYEMGRDLLIVWLEGLKREASTQENLGAFYDSVPGDVYTKASKTWFLPRRWWHEHKNDTLLEAIPPGSESVFDVGFGSGTLFEGLADRDIHKYGLDLGRGFIKHVHSEHGDAVTIFQSDALNIPLKENVMDSVICSEVLEHVPDPSRAIEEMYRILKPHGTLLLTTPNISLRWVIIEAIWTRVRRQIIETKHVAFTRRRLRYNLITAGFKIKKDRVFMFGCLNFVVAQK